MATTREVVGWPYKNLQQVLDEEWPEDELLVGPHLIYKSGKVQVYGATGVKKSFLVQQLAISLATGEDWVGYPVHRKACCLYVQCEITPSLLQKRLRAATSTLTVPVHNLLVSSVYDRVLAKTQDFIDLSEVVEKQEVDVLIIDPLYLFMKGTEAREVGDFLRGLNYINGGTGAAIVLVHHARKKHWSATGEAVDTGIDSAKGQTDLVQWPDTVVSVRAKEAYTEIRWEKTRHGQLPPPRLLRFDGKNMRFKVEEQGPNELILELLRNGPVLVQDMDEVVMQETGLSKVQIGRVRRDLVSAGFITTQPDKEDKRKVWMKEA